MAYSLEIKARARALYVEGGLTYEEVTGETNVSLSQLKEWGKEGTWMEARTQYERSFLELHTNVQKVKLQLSQKAVQSGDPQLIYALSTLMRSTTPKASASRGQDKASLFLEFANAFVTYLKDRDGEAMRYLEPHLRGFAETTKQSEVF